MENKITAEELKEIQELQANLYKLTTDIGVLETQKHAVLHELAGVNQTQEEYKKVLENKYGPININLEDGSFEVVKKENE
jgi:hypothetical protein|tara:strand:+ start:984 stop:1223 length:240 start_codon:yes stop_codon:yes gene_type:complete